jgi:hypothetical protein
MLTGEREEGLQNLALEVDKEEIEKKGEELESECNLGFKTATDERHASAAK